MAFIVTGYDSVTFEPIERDITAFIAELTAAGGISPQLDTLARFALNGGGQDTNDAQREYAWNVGAGVQGFETDGTLFTALEEITVQVTAKIAVLNATANDRAAFLTSIMVLETDLTTIRDQYCFTSTYIRDDSGAYDKGVGAGVASMTLQPGQAFRVQTNRLSSQDPNDDNPADAAASLLRIERWV